MQEQDTEKYVREVPTMQPRFDAGWHNGIGGTWRVFGACRLPVSEVGVRKSINTSIFSCNSTRISCNSTRKIVSTNGR